MRKLHNYPLTPIFHRGQWLYRLADPYRQTPFLPVTARELADKLGIPYRSALRIAKGDSPLPEPARHYLQWVYFGFIPDDEFSRRGFFIRSGELRCHQMDGLNITPGDLQGLFMLLPEYKRMLDEFHAAKARADEIQGRYERLRVRYRETVKELKALKRAETPAAPDMSNVIRFPGRR